MEPEKNLEKNPPKPIVETLAGDMAKALENNQGGVIKKIIEGEEEREKEKKNTSPESRRNKIFLVTSICLILAGGALLSYFWSGRPAGTAAIAPEFTPLIFTDKSDFVESAGLKPKEIIQSLENHADTSGLKPNGIVAVYLTLKGEKVGLRQFLSLLKMNFAPDTNPILVKDSFMVGRVNVEGSEEKAKGFFILLQARSAGDIFDSLRIWEEKMFYDLHDFFGESVTAANNYLLTKDFEDKIVENKNARVLADNEGNIVLMYVFADNDSVVIADSPEAVREIILRLGAKQTKE
jgi:hypothetical protein